MPLVDLLGAKLLPLGQGKMPSQLIEQSRGKQCKKDLTSEVWTSSKMLLKEHSLIRLRSWQICQECVKIGPALVSMPLRRA